MKRRSRAARSARCGQGERKGRRGRRDDEGGGEHAVLASTTGRRRRRGSGQEVVHVCGVDRIRPRVRRGRTAGESSAGGHFLCALAVNGGLERPSGPSYRWRTA